MTRKKKTAPKPKESREPKNLRTIIASLADPVKARLVQVLVDLSKTDVRAAQLWAQVSGEGGSFKNPAPARCCFSVNLNHPIPKYDDDPDPAYENSPTVPAGWDEDEPYQEESDEERQSRW